MTPKINRSTRRGRALLTLAAVMLSCATVSQAQSTRTPWRNLTLEQLTAVHWQWLFSCPASATPVLDDTGANAFSNQPYFTAPGGKGQLLFLAGTFSVNLTATGDTLGQTTRTISFKQGTSLFFPLLDGEWDNILQSPHLGGMVLGHPLGVPALTQLVSASPDTATDLVSTLNDSDLAILRLKSAPFAYTLPKTDNLLQSSGLDISGTVAPAVSDGFFSFVPASALPAGNYVLHFGGSFPFNDVGNLFTEDITYLITVTP